MQSAGSPLSCGTSGAYYKIKALEKRGNGEPNKVLVPSRSSDGSGAPSDLERRVGP